MRATPRRLAGRLSTRLGSGQDYLLAVLIGVAAALVVVAVVVILGGA